MAQKQKKFLSPKPIFILIAVCGLLPFRIVVDSMLIGGAILTAIITAEVKELFK